MTIILGCDHGGFNLKNEVIKYFNNKNVDYKDMGIYSSQSVDYPLIAFNTANEVMKLNTKGILFCGSGLGMAIAANKIKGVRAVCVTDAYMAILSREHNDANILCLGERILGINAALYIIETWLNTPFLEGRHKKRVQMLNEFP